MDHTSGSQRMKQRRSSRACQGCRLAKTKCEPNSAGSDQTTCRRCAVNALPCHFAVSRRGRIKGSKNLRTLQQMSQNRTLHQETLQAPPSDPARQSQDVESLGQSSDDEVGPPQCSENANSRSRHGSFVGPGPNTIPGTGQASHRITLARNILHVLGDFPVEDETKGQDAVAGECRAKGLQEPLWLMAGLAKRGWEVHEGKGKRKRTPPQPKALSSSSLSVEETRLLDKWSVEALEKGEKEQSQYFKHGVYASKCDVAPALDPINHGLVTEERARDLFQEYWNVIQAQWSLLDAKLHTPDAVRQRSALLTTTILAIGSTSLATRPGSTPEQISEALGLHAHVEKLSLVIFATGAKSIEIVQAHILLCRWGTAPKTRLCENRWIRSGMIPRMAEEVGLATPRRNETPTGIEAARIEALHWNDLRTRAFIIMNEHRFSTFNGRRPQDLPQFELHDDELERLASEESDMQSHGSVAALYHLFLFDRDTRRRIAQFEANSRIGFLLDAELEHTKVYIEEWTRKWCPGDNDPRVNWYLTHDALSCWLLLAVQIAKVRLESSHAAKVQQQNHGHQQLLLSLATRIFVEALKVPDAIRMTQRAAIFPFAASIVLRLGSRRDLVLRVALRMAGESGEHHVSTFVRESGIQMLLLLYRNGGSAGRSSSPTPEDHAETQPVPSDKTGKLTSTGEDLESEHQSHQEISHPEPLLPEPTGAAVYEQPEQSFPSFDRIYPPHQPDTNDVFTFSAADFPQVPDMTQPQLQYHDPVNRYYPYTDFKLDDLLGGPIQSETFTNTEEMQQLHGQSMGQGPAPACSVPFSNMPYDAMAAACQGQPAAGGWPMDDLSPANTAFAASSDANGGEDRGAQRRFLLSAVDRLIQLASLI